MGNLLTPTHLIVILLIILVLFGRGRISEFMGDFGKGIKSFKKGLKEDGEAEDEETANQTVTKTIEVEPENSIETIEKPVAEVPKAAKTTARKASAATSTKTTSVKTTTKPALKAAKAVPRKTSKAKS